MPLRCSTKRSLAWVCPPRPRVTSAATMSSAVDGASIALLVTTILLREDAPEHLALREGTSRGEIDCRRRLRDPDGRPDRRSGRPVLPPPPLGAVARQHRDRAGLRCLLPEVPQALID